MIRAVQYTVIILAIVGMINIVSLVLQKYNQYKEKQEYEGLSHYGITYKHRPVTFLGFLWFLLKKIFYEGLPNIWFYYTYPLIIAIKNYAVMFAVNFWEKYYLTCGSNRSYYAWMTVQEEPLFCLVDIPSAILSHFASQWAAYIISAIVVGAMWGLYRLKATIIMLFPRFQLRRNRNNVPAAYYSSSGSSISSSSLSMSLSSIQSYDEMFSQPSSNANTVQVPTSTRSHTPQRSGEFRGDGSQVADSEPPLDIYLNERGKRRIPVQRDGHCLINAFARSLESEGLRRNVRTAELHGLLASEIYDNYAYYTSYSDSGNNIFKDVDLFINDSKRCTSDTLDVVITALCNTLHVSAQVYVTKTDGIEELTVEPSRPGIVSTGCVHIALEADEVFDHYDAVVPVDSQSTNS